MTIFHFWLYTYCVLSNNLLTSSPSPIFLPVYLFLKSTLLLFCVFIFLIHNQRRLSSMIPAFMFIKYSHACRVWHQQRKRQSGKSSFKHFLIFFASSFKLLCFMLTLYEQQQQLSLFFSCQFFCFYFKVTQILFFPVLLNGNWVMVRGKEMKHKKWHSNIGT